MKTKDLVECINNKQMEKYVKLNTPYTVMRIIKAGEILVKEKNGMIQAGEDGIYLEEVKSPDAFIHGMIIEMPFPLNRFRELMPNLEKEVEEILELEIESV